MRDTTTEGGNRKAIMFATDHPSGDSGAVTRGWRSGALALTILLGLISHAPAQELKHSFLLRDTSFSSNPELAAPGDNTIFMVNEADEIAEVLSDRLEVLLGGSTLVDAFTYGRDIGGNNDHSFFLFTVSRHPLGGTGGAPKTPLSKEPPTEAESDLVWIQDWPAPLRVLDIHFKATDENNASPVPWAGFFDVARHLGLTGTYGAPRMAPPFVSNVAAFDYFHPDDLGGTIPDCYFSVSSTVTIGPVTIRPADVALLDGNGTLSIFKPAEELALDGTGDNINALAMNLTGIGVPGGHKLGWFSLTRDSASLNPGLSAADIFQFDSDVDHGGGSLASLVQMTAESLGLLSRFSALSSQDADIDGLSHLDPESMVGCPFQLDLGGALDLECENALDGGYTLSVNDQTYASAQGNEISVPSPPLNDGDYAAVILKGRQGRRPGTVDEFLAQSVEGSIVQVPSPVPSILQIQAFPGLGDELFWEWTNPSPNPYDFIEVRLDDGPPQVLPGAATEFQELNLPPGVHTLEVRGVAFLPDETRSEPVFSAGYLEPPITEIENRQPPEDLQVTLVDQDVLLSWTTTVPTLGFELHFDGQLIPLPDPAADSFIFPGVPFGLHTIGIRSFTPGFPLPTVFSNVEVVIPVPVPGQILQVAPFAGGNPSGVAVHEDLGLVFIADRDTGQTFVHDLGDLNQPPANLPSPGPLGSTVTGIAVDEGSGTLFWAVNDQLFLTDLDGNPVPGGGPIYLDPSSSARDLTFDGATLWVADVLQGVFTQHDPGSGFFLGGVLPHPLGNGAAVAIAAREGGAFEVTAGPGVPVAQQWALDPAGDPVAHFPLPGGIQGMAFAFQGSRGVPSIIAVGQGGQIFEIAAEAPLVPPDAGDCHRLPIDSLRVLDFPGGDYLESVTSVVEVTGEIAVVNDVDVTLAIDHPLVEQLMVTLTSPQGTSVTVYQGSAGSVEQVDRRIDDLGTGNLDDRFGTRVSDGAALATFDGEPVNGEWLLTVEHEFPTPGQIIDARVSICTVPGGPPDPQFIRGDADGDGVFNGVVDGLRVLNYQFVPGTPEPPCLDAADADDDNIFNGVLDGLVILNHAFVAGSPPPAPPFPDCGNDLTPGGEGCKMSAMGCP